MPSTPTPKPSDDPHDIAVIAPDAVRVVPAEDQISELLHEAATRFRSDPKPRAGSDFPAGPMVRPVEPVDTTFRRAAVNDALVPGKSWPRLRRAARGVIALLLAACIGVAAVGWRAYGDSAKKQVAKLTTQFALFSPFEQSAPAAQPAAPAVQADAADAAAPQPAASAQPAEGVAPTAAAASAASDSAPSLQSMARDLASVGQQVEQLKASIEQLKASQQQISRDVAKVSEVKASEQNLRPRKPAPPPRSAAAPARAPVPPYPPRQAAATPILPPAPAPYVPRQFAPPPPPPSAAVDTLDEPEMASAPRPPMPLR